MMAAEFQVAQERLHHRVEMASRELISVRFCSVIVCPRADVVTLQLPRALGAGSPDTG